jgi:YVTN family beta-propeller protein
VAAIPTGVSPVGVAVNGATNRIYVTNLASNSVTVIDGNTRTALATIPVGTVPEQAAVNSQTNRIYVTNYGSNSVSVIDGETNTVIATIPVGHSPDGIAANPNTNRIYVTNYGSNSVSVIDGAINTGLSTIGLGPSPVGVGVNPTTNRIYVSTADDNQVSVIDGTTHAIIATIAVGENPIEVAVNPITNRIYVGNNSGDSVSVIDGVTNTVVDTIRPPGLCCPSAIAVSPNINRVYVNNYSDYIAVIDGLTNTVVSTLLAGDGNYGIKVRAANRVYVSNFWNNNVSVFFENELLKNASFEANTIRSHFPDDWKGQNFDGTIDRLVKEAYEGRWSFQLTGAAEVTKRLSQTIAASGPAGTTLMVEGFSKAEGTSATGGAYKIEVKVIFTDDTSSTFAIHFTKATHDWERKVRRFVASKDFKQLHVSSVYANQTGTVWFDALHVWPE